MGQCLISLNINILTLFSVELYYEYLLNKTAALAQEATALIEQSTP
jgi:hypothetical protein